MPAPPLTEGTDAQHVTAIRSSLVAVVRGRRRSIVRAVTAFAVHAKGRAMSSYRAERTPGVRQPWKALLYGIGASLGLLWVLRLWDIPAHSVPPAGTVAEMARLLGSTTGGALVGYGLWWVAWRRGRLCRKFCSGGHEGAVAPVCGGITRRGSRTVRPQ